MRLKLRTILLQTAMPLFNGTLFAKIAAELSISYTADASGDVTIVIDFPQENTHHLIINGVAPFRSIEIYDTPYRTDPRFETYNSSGYVYNAETRTLFLKSRHRAQREVIRLIYRAPPAPPEPEPDAEQNVPQTQDNPVPSSNAVF
jgi:hypothetical protein